MNLPVTPSNGLEGEGPWPLSGMCNDSIASSKIFDGGNWTVIAPNSIWFWPQDMGVVIAAKETYGVY